MPNELVKASPHDIARTASGFVLPAVIVDAGDQAAKRFVEFFTATIRNPHTRKAYAYAAGVFFACCEHHPVQPDRFPERRSDGSPKFCTFPLGDYSPFRLGCVQSFTSSDLITLDMVERVVI